MRIHFKLPERPRRKPVVVIAVENEGGVIPDSAVAHQAFEIRLSDDVAPDYIAQLGLPIPSHRAGDMPLAIGGCVDVDLRDHNIGIASMQVNPLGGNEDFRIGI